jgi:cytochrome P450 family 110
MPTLAPLVDLSQRIVDEVRARGPYGRLPPGPPEPALAQTLAWIARPVQFLERGHRRYGDVFTMRLVGVDVDPFVMVRDPEIIREVFTGPPELLRAGEANVVLEPFVGSSSVLLLDGPRHLSQRRLLLPPFHGQRMRAYGAIIRDATLRSMAAWPRGQAFPLHERTQTITLDVILRAVFGVEDAAPLRELDETLATLLERLANPIWLLRPMQRDLGPLSPGGRLARLLERVDALIHALIRERRAEDRTGREDILTMLLEARHEDGSPMSDVELRDELVTLLVAGHETTATSLAWTFHRLLDAPDVLREAVAEVDRVFPDGHVDPDRVGELRYLDAVIKETLRTNPVVPLVGRRLQAPMRFHHLELPRGVVVVPAIYSTHHNPRVWPDPERFDPSRFLGAKPSPYAFFPFGGGVRRCIGMAFALYEMQVVLATVLAKLRVRRPAGPPVRIVRRAITFAPSHGMPLSVEDRAR